MKQEILDLINELIEDEKGTAVTMGSTFLDADLDSLGATLVLIELDSDYPFLRDVPEDSDMFVHLDIPNLTIRELIQKCRLSIINISKEQSEEMAT